MSNEVIVMYLRSYLEIDEDKYRHNIRTLQKISGKKLIGVVKANAYGMGDVRASEILIEEGVEMLAVSSIDEALHLRRNRIGCDILILGYTDRDDLKKVRDNDLSIVTVSKDYVERNRDMLQGIRVHLKLNTGMNRIGVRPYEAKEVLEKLIECGAKVEGIMTHYTSSDESEEVTKRQYDMFKETVESLDYPFEYIHIANSDGTVHFGEKFATHCRPGLALLGLSSYESDLQPCLSLYSQVVDCKRVPYGEKISYGGHYTSEDDWIITLPIGYADGFRRSNTGKEVYVDGEYGTIVGSVCMDQMMVKVSRKIEIGTEVELYGEHIDVRKRAEEVGTIPYELYTDVSDRIARVYASRGEIVKILLPRFN